MPVRLVVLGGVVQAGRIQQSASKRVPGLPYVCSEKADLLFSDPDLCHLDP